MRRIKEQEQLMKKLINGLYQPYRKGLSMKRYIISRMKELRLCYSLSIISVCVLVIS